MEESFAGVGKNPPEAHAETLASSSNINPAAMNFICVTLISDYLLERRAARHSQAEPQNKLFLSMFAGKILSHTRRPQSIDPKIATKTIKGARVIPDFEAKNPKLFVI
jgi:hypothetical protein